MTVKVRVKKVKFCFAVPISLVLFGLKKANCLQAKVDKRIKREIKDGLKKAKKNFGRLVLIDMHAADGTKVKITM